MPRTCLLCHTKWSNALETEKAVDAVSPMPGYDPVFAQKFVMKHGLAVRAVGIIVNDTKAAYEISV
ncbi:putative glyoxalase/Bleomycin resistance protein/Dihydroxybiphenyl dioxygenase [Plasmopara halstedii]